MPVAAALLATALTPRTRRPRASTRQMRRGSRPQHKATPAGTAGLKAALREGLTVLPAVGLEVLVLEVVAPEAEAPEAEALEAVALEAVGLEAVVLEADPDTIELGAQHWRQRQSCMGMGTVRPILTCARAPMLAHEKFELAADACCVGRGQSGTASGEGA